MTWNLWWRFGEWERRATAIRAVVEGEAPDVVCLQEVWGDGAVSSASILADALGWSCTVTDDPFAGRRGDRPAFHDAIVSRHPILRTDSVALPGADGAPGHRRALVAVLDTPAGPWPVVSTHLDHRFDASAVRQAQCTALLGIVAAARAGDASPPPIVAGDLNAVPDSDEIRMLTGRRASSVPGVVLSDCWEQVGDGPGWTWRRENPHLPDTAWPNRRLDYVLVAWPRPKPLGNPRRAWLAGVDPVDGVQPSDHAAVVVDLVGW